MTTTTGDFIRKARLERGFSQAMLARQSGVCMTSIKQIESGKHGGTLETFVRLADALHISIDELVGHEVKEAPYGKA